MSTVASADLITCAREAKLYYRKHLAGVRRVTCHSHRIEIVFPMEAVHIYSEKAPEPFPSGAEMVSQPLSEGRFEVRVFSLRRARLMDRLLPAISSFTVSIEGTGPKGRENKVLHGPRLACGEYMRVVLRPGPKTAWTCVSAFPVSDMAWREAMRSKRARFPP